MKSLKNLGLIGLIALASCAPRPRGTTLENNPEYVSFQQEYHHACYILDVPSKNVTMLEEHFLKEWDKNHVLITAGIIDGSIEVTKRADGEYLMSGNLNPYSKSLRNALGLTIKGIDLNEDNILTTEEIIDFQTEILKLAVSKRNTI